MSPCVDFGVNFVVDFSVDFNGILRTGVKSREKEDDAEEEG